MKRSFFLLIMVLFMGGVLPQAPAAPERSGIEGVALVGPISPVQRPGDPNVAPLPFAVITVQRHNGGPEIARAVADENGGFRLPLRPGKYLIVPLAPDPTAPLPRSLPQMATVRGGKFTSLVVLYDTGIR